MTQTVSASKLPNNTRVTCLLTAKDFPFSMMDRGGKTELAPLFVRLATGREEDGKRAEASLASMKVSNIAEGKVAASSLAHR